MQALFLTQWQAFLSYTDLPGAEPACVYLHGSGLASSITYARVVAEPALAQRRSILIDVLGCGFSDRPDSFRYTLTDHAQTIAALLDHLGLSECAVIGHSFGGSIAITLAAIRPDLVGRLVLAEALLDPGGGDTSRRIAAQSESEFCTAGFPALLAEVRSEALAGDPLSIAVAAAFQVAAPFALYRSAVGLVQGTQPTMRERLLRLSIPRTYLFGEHSLPHPDRTALPAHGVAVQVVPNAGHGMMWEQPRAFAAALHAALTRDECDGLA
jgi:pimeloyl-ACP methyl ester carboxylesterase